MKKTILTALTIAWMAMGAQAQLNDNPSEYTNPFASIGMFDYIQKQSDGKVGKWFLSGKNGKDKYFTTEKFSLGEDGYSECRAAKIINKRNGNADDLQLCCIYEVKENSPLIKIRGKIRYENFGEFTEKASVRVSVTGYDEQPSIKGHESNIKNISSNISSYINNNTTDDNILINETSTFYWNENSGFDYGCICNNKYICIQIDLGTLAGTYYIFDVSISENGESDNGIINHYFNEPITLIQYNTNGGEKMDNMYCLYENTKNKNSKTHIFHIFNKKGEELGSGAYDWSEKIDFYSTPTRNGYNFLGWQLNGENYNFETNPTAMYPNKPTLSPLMNDIILVAQWEGENGSVTTAVNDSEAQSYYSNGVLYTSEYAEIAIYTMGGVKVKSAYTNQLNVSELKAGLYIARIGNETIKFSK